MKNTLPKLRSLLIGLLLIAVYACRHDAPTPTPADDITVKRERQPEAPTSQSSQRLAETHCYQTWDYYYNTVNGDFLGREYVGSYCVTTGDGSGGGGDTGSGGGGGGGGTGGGSGTGTDTPGVKGVLIALRDPNTILSPGPKPLAEFLDRCAGAQGLWELGVKNNYSEVYGYLTPNGQIIATAILGSAGGSVGQGLYEHDPGDGTFRYYYYYPVSLGAPAQKYPGMLEINGNYYIPVIANIHTHTPCVNDGTDGVTGHLLGEDDKAMAREEPRIRHYIIGCGGTIGSFSATSYYPTVLSGGSSSCSNLQ